MVKFLVSNSKKVFSAGVSLIFASIFCIACKEKTIQVFELLPSDDTHIYFNNVIKEDDSLNVINYQYIYNGGGVGIGDFNNDQLSDIFFTANLVSNRLYLNKGNLEFQDVTNEAGLNSEGIWSSGVAIIDINNDGWQDIYVSVTFSSDSIKRKNRLYINKGLNTAGIPVFEEKAESFGIAYNGYSTQSVFFDYDLDGDLDLYVLNNVLIPRRYSTLLNRIGDGSSPTNDRLFKNNGDNTFTDVTIRSGILLEGYGLGIAVLDINHDSYPDLYISNDFITNDVLWVNQKDGTFLNLFSDYFAHQSRASMGNEAADINNDCLIDVMTLDMLPEEQKRQKQMFASNDYRFHQSSALLKYDIQYSRNCLQLNNGIGKFSDISQMTGVNATDWSWSVHFADYDNDGLKDIFITNGLPRDPTDMDYATFLVTPQKMFASKQDLINLLPVVKLPKYVFKNMDDLNFRDVSKDWGVTTPGFSNGAAFTDLDNDGDLDYVINNINDQAFLYKNNTSDQTPNHYIKIRLKGSSLNRQGIGSEVTVKYDGISSFHYNSPYRGYISSVDPIIHCGLGKSEKVDSVIVRWPDGKFSYLTKIKLDTIIEIDYKNASTFSGRLERTVSVFTDNTQDSLLQFYHRERDFFEHNVQPLIPHGLANEGPGLAVGDINNDGLEDIYIGNGRNRSGKLFVQGNNGLFSITNFTDTTSNEDMGVLLFDADNDGDLDLYIGSGSSEYKAYSTNYRDKLYVNTGKGNFLWDSLALPDIKISTSVVTAADFDKDGDLDLFIGGRSVPQSYPLPEDSYILINKGGKFSGMESSLIQGFSKIGMVTTAVWTDFDNDSWRDLIIAGEWMSIHFFKNNKGVFQEVTDKTGLTKTNGWWRSICPGDFDNDGDIDYVIGNQGLNNRYKTSNKDFPLLIYGKDFDKNGSVECIMAEYHVDGYYPIHLRDDFFAQQSYLKKKALTFKEYGVSKMEDLFPIQDLSSAYKAEVHTFESVYIQNLGNGKFSMASLPRKTQIAPVTGLLAEDFDFDGNLDILAVGNNFRSEVFNGRHDAFVGLLLKGDGHLNFKEVPLPESGFVVPGEGKALGQIFKADNTPLIIATQNNSNLKTFTYLIPETKIRVRPGSNHVKAKIYFQNGAIQLREFYWGTSTLTAGSRDFLVNKKQVNKIVMIDASGAESEYKMID